MRTLRLLFSATAFLSAFLLFLVQPMMAKILLPQFGGAPAVWLVAMVFFQGMLVLGYLYAHKFASRSQRHSWAHLLVMLVALFSIGGSKLFNSIPTNPPALGVMLMLLLMIGLPFLAVSANAPLLQRWYATTNATDRNNPYQLYAASNLGSFASLLVYPFVVEPNLTLHEQLGVWKWGFVGLMISLAFCATQIRGSTPLGAPTSTTVTPSATRWRWIVLAAVPSALLMGVINFLAQNIAPIPFLWIVPMSLYLLTFVVAFSAKRKFGTKWLARATPILITSLLLPLVLESTEPLIAMAILHLVTVSVLMLCCHMTLSDEAPEPTKLTEFFLYISIGGVVGGIFVGFLAPLIFTKYVEYPLALVAACFLLPRPAGQTLSRKDLLLPLAAGVLVLLGATFGRLAGLEGTALIGVSIAAPALLTFFCSDKVYRYATAVVLFYVCAQFANVGVPGRVLLSKRSFFGVHRVVESDDGGTLHRSLIHGNTIHGRENAGSGKPLTYYYPSGPIGQIFLEWASKKPNAEIGLVGLGVGSLAYYGLPGQKMTYYEIDPAVVKIARDPALFTFLKNCKSPLNIVEGDARLTLSHENRKFDLLVLDAFTSDSVPLHLLTIEAMKLYVELLKPGGIIAFHISNRYLSLKEVLAAAAQQNGMRALLREDSAPEETRLDDVQRAEIKEGKTDSQWMLICRSLEDIVPLNRDIRWNRMIIEPGVAPWRDDFSNLLDALLRNKDPY